MSEWLTNPAVQGGIAPFVIALIVAVVFSKLSPWQGLALVAAFATALYLTVGFVFEPLTSTRKLILATLLAPLLILIVMPLTISRGQRMLVLMAAAAGLCLWLLWPVLARNGLAANWQTALASAAYAAWWVMALYAFDRREQVQGGAAVFASAMGTSLTALLGASALLAQLAGSLAAGTAALLLVALFIDSRRAGMIFVITAAIALGLLGPAMVVYAKVPWYVLLALACSPLLARLPLAGDLSLWKKIAVWTVVCAVPAALSVYLTWSAEGPVPF